MICHIFHRALFMSQSISHFLVQRLFLSHICHNIWDLYFYKTYIMFILSFINVINPLAVFSYDGFSLSFVLSWESSVLSSER